MWTIEPPSLSCDPTWTSHRVPGSRAPAEALRHLRAPLLSPVTGQAAARGPPPAPPDWSAAPRLPTLHPAPARSPRGRRGFRRAAAVAGAGTAPGWRPGQELAAACSHFRFRGGGWGAERDLDPPSPRLLPVEPAFRRVLPGPCDRGQEAAAAVARCGRTAAWRTGKCGTGTWEAAPPPSARYGGAGCPRAGARAEPAEGRPGGARSRWPSAERMSGAAQVSWRCRGLPGAWSLKGGSGAAQSLRAWGLPPLSPQIRALLKTRLPSSTRSSQKCGSPLQRRHGVTPQAKEEPLRGSWYFLWRLTPHALDMVASFKLTVHQFRVLRPFKEYHLGVLRRQRKLGGGTRRKPTQPFLPHTYPFCKEDFGSQIWKWTRAGAPKASCSYETLTWGGPFEQYFYHTRGLFNLVVIYDDSTLINQGRMNHRPSAGNSEIFWKVFQFKIIIIINLPVLWTDWYSVKMCF